MKYVLSTTIGSLLICAAVAQPKYTTIKMDERFSRAIEISSMVCVNDSIYLASPVCDSVYIGKINKNDSLEIHRVKYLGGCDYEGASFYKGNFYFSDDGANAIFKYKRSFMKGPTVYPLRLKDNEGAKSNNGFEGIAAINATTFYLLLEKVNTFQNQVKHPYSILYKGLIRGDSISLVAKKYIPLNGNRYCDLLYNKSSNTLYLLKTGDGHYQVDSLQLDAKHNIPAKYHVKGAAIPLITPGLVFDFSEAVKIQKKENFHPNIEGLSRVNKHTWYVISDNCDFGKLFCGCKQTGENRKTLLMRVEIK